jgi:Ca2+-binding RTX toxin-like protein
MSSVANDVMVGQIFASTGVGTATETIGNPIDTNHLKHFTSLASFNGVYYNKSLNVIAITKDGVTLDGYDFRGVSINVQADDVTIRNSTFDASTGIYAINAFPGTKNLTVDYSTFDGLKLDKIGYADFITARGENTTLTHNAFLDAPSDGVVIQSGTISGNYFAGGGYATGAHADAIWIGATNAPVVIADNVIDWRVRADAPTATNNAVRIASEMGNISDVLVKNNIILGGSYTVLVSDGATQAKTVLQMGSITGVKVVGNVVDYGKFGDLYPTSRPKDMIYADNLHTHGGATTPGLEAAGSFPDLSTLNTVNAAAPGAVIKGTAKSDYILGGSDSNYIEGGAGDDVIAGGGGRDFISGGTGNDIFVYRTSPDDGIDRIADFVQGQDRIDLATILGAPKALPDWQWLGSDSFTGHAWQLHYTQSDDATVIELDANGDLKADLKIELTGKIALSTSDFILVHNADLVTTPVQTPISTQPGASPQTVTVAQSNSAAVPSAAPEHLNLMFRFFDTHTGDHFYTTSAVEKAQIQASLPTFNYEGSAWTTPDKGPDTHDVFRFFDTKTGTHFLTDSVAERDVILATIPNYTYEGVAFEAYNDVAGAGRLTLDRFYNTQTGQHHFSASPEETAGINQGAAGLGWISEGKAFTVHMPTDGGLYA